MAKSDDPTVTPYLAKNSSKILWISQFLSKIFVIIF